MRSTEYKYIHSLVLRQHTKCGNTPFEVGCLPLFLDVLARGSSYARTGREAIMMARRMDGKGNVKDDGEKSSDDGLGLRFQDRLVFWERDDALGMSVFSFP